MFIIGDHHALVFGSCVWLALLVIYLVKLRLIATITTIMSRIPPLNRTRRRLPFKLVALMHLRCLRISCTRGVSWITKYGLILNLHSY